MIVPYIALDPSLNNGQATLRRLLFHLIWGRQLRALLGLESWGACALTARSAEHDVLPEYPESYFAWRSGRECHLGPESGSRPEGEGLVPNETRSLSAGSTLTTRDCELICFWAFGFAE
jgi:hypothetical protein